MFSFPLAALELLFLAINATLKLEDWVGYMLCIMKKYLTGCEFPDMNEQEG